MPALVIIGAYLIGSIPTAYLFSCYFLKKDIRQLGDGNAGSQNAARFLGRGKGVLIAVIDIAKGSLVIGLATWAGSSTLVVMVAGVAAVAGHNWPFFLGFRGGRGAAVVFGELLVLFFRPMLFLLLPAGLVLLLTRNTTPTLAVLFAPLPFIAWFMHLPGSLIAYGVFLMCLTGFTHFLRTRQVGTHVPTESDQGG